MFWPWVLGNTGGVDDPRAPHRDTADDASDVEGELPVGTVTLLLADVEGSTRLWESEPEAMTAALARLDGIVDEIAATYSGVRPVEQGEGDSFVIAFARASDAVACALDLQLAPLAPIRLRIGLHTGEVQLRDDHNYMGPAMNRAARIRDLAHGGQTVLSGVTHDLVIDCLPNSAWLVDLGSHSLRDLTRPERVVQLCHPDVPVEFPALRSLDAFAHNLPVQLTRFIGREAEMTKVVRLLDENRLVTLTGAGGAGKTRLAIQVAVEQLAEYPGGVWQVDLAPLTDPAVVPVAVSRALGLPDEPGRSTINTVISFLADHHALLLLDNCEHLLDACAVLIDELLRACPALDHPGHEPRTDRRARRSNMARPITRARRRSDRAIRRPGPTCPTRLRHHPRQRGCGRRDLPSSRRDPARDRTRRSARPRLLTRRDRRGAA